MSAKPMPVWLEAHLIQTGVMTADRVTKHAHPRRCTCGLFTLVGLDDLLPTKVTVDPQPTTTTGEAHAVLTGRRTYGIDGDELYPRTAGRIEFRPADDTPVYVSHECGSTPLPISTKFNRAQIENINSTEIPF